MHGEYKPGEKLPGEKLLAKELGVSLVTLRAALAMLQHAGIVNCIDRSGNYVAENLDSHKKYLAVVTGDDFENISVACMYYINELQKNLAVTGDRLKIILSTQLEKKFTENKWHSRLAKDNISGIFLCEGGYNGNEKSLNLLRSANLPVVQLAGVPSDRELYDFPILLRYSSETFSSGVKYLISLGHKKIATLFPQNGCMRGFTPETYKDFLTKAGIPEANSLVCYFKKKNQLASIIRKLMIQPSPPTAFMCYCDATAMYALETLDEMGYDVPEQISVMGICGYTERLFTLKPLSVVNFHYDISASEAVKLMNDSASWYGKKQNITQIIPHEIIARSTTAVCSENIK